MKKLISLMLGLCLITMAWAQVEEETVRITPVKKGDEPKAVMDAIHTDFPNALSTNLNFLPLKLYGEQWNVQTDGTAPASGSAFYQVNVREQNQSFKAVYDKNGKLQHSKVMIKQAELPEAVVAAISKAHPGYKIVRDVEKITSDRAGNVNVVYHVTIRKEHNLSHGIFVDPTGKILRDIHFV
ncbi:MAG TPA: hypothetical protein VIM75_02125 [Ohtaekwangia sp.]|uniref:hypothetical protein n=1 Tax=Ohtaekwangia sp. TaxID=2066019 RepID=UPI002F92FCE1